jgi:hypothetical protein
MASDENGSVRGVKIHVFGEKALIGGRKHTGGNDRDIYSRDRVIESEGCHTDDLKARERGFRSDSNEDMISDEPVKI